MKLFTHFSVVVCAVALLGCGGSKDAQLAGHYYCTTVDANGNDTGKNIPERFRMDLTLDLKSDGTFSMGGFLKYEGTWTYKERQVRLAAVPVKEPAKNVTATPTTITFDVDPGDSLVMLQKGKRVFPAFVFKK